jgi:hypothetical protein
MLASEYMPPGSNPFNESLGIYNYEVRWTRWSGPVKCHECDKSARELWLLIDGREGDQYTICTACAKHY